MSCPAKHRLGADTYVSYAAGLLGETERAAFERHMADCPECARLASEQRRVWAALDGWTAAPVPEDFDAKLYARIAEEGKHRWWHALRRPGFSFRLSTAAPVAVACAALAVALLLRAPQPLPSAHSAPAPATATVRPKLDADQVERTLDDLDMLQQLVSPPADSNDSRS